VRVLIVDDYEFVRRGVRALLITDPEIEVVGEAADGEEAVSKVQQLKPDVVILDLSMPRMNGLQATREIKRLSSNIAVLMLSQHDSPQVAREALQAGAAEYITKSSLWSKLLPALQRLQLGQASLHAAAPTKLLRGSAEAVLSTDVSNQTLSESEERFLSAFEQTAVGMAHVSDSGTWLRVNQKLCQIAGYSKAELQKLTFHDLIHPADLPADLDHAERMAAGEIDHYSLEERYVRKDGGIAWVRVTADAVRDFSGRLKYCVLVFEDASAKKVAEQQCGRAQRDLHISSGHLDLLMQRTAAPLTRCSRDLRYEWVNQQYADWLCQPVDKIVGRPILDVLGKQAFQALQPRFDQVLSGTEVAYQDSVVCEGIGLRAISAAYKPTLDASGSPDGWVALVQDVTTSAPTKRQSSSRTA
jgi:PAS domain S-box-containing protein